MFISKKKYNELINKIDTMQSLLGDILQHTGRVIDNNQAVLHECKDLIEINNKILDEFSDKYKQLFVYAYSTASIVNSMNCEVNTSASTDTGTDS